jgi:hypothetical protein
MHKSGRSERLESLEQKQTDEFAAQAYARISRQKADHDR